MNRMSAALAGLLLLAVVGSYATSQQPERARKSIFSLLKPGQAVELSEYHGREFFRIYEAENQKAMMKSKIKEINDDFIVVTNEADPNGPWGPTEQYLPLHVVSSIVFVKGKNAK
jgi:hypothetical protein